MREEFIDFDESRILWILNNGSHGLWSIDSKTTERTSNQSIFLCSEIMAGNVYGIKNLPKFPSYHFQVAFSTNNEFRFFRNGIVGKNKDTHGKNDQMFNELRLFERKKVLVRIINNEHLITAVRNGENLFGSINYDDGDKRYEINFPIHHINVREDLEPYFQVETGPILTLENKKSSLSDANLNYIFFSNFYKAYILKKKSIRIMRLLNLMGNPFKDFTEQQSLENCNIKIYFEDSSKTLRHYSFLSNE